MSMDQINQLIENEFERRMTERLNSILSKISQTYDISLKQLMRDIDMGTSTWNGHMCHGLTKQNKKCPRGAPDGSGYCKIHKSQKPPPRAVQVNRSASPPIQHTHTLPPMFLAGCPACQRAKIPRLDI